MKNLSPLPLLVLVLMWLYIGVAFLAPVLMNLGYTDIGNGIYEFYENFCHQRVERSLFLFGESSFYTIEELNEDGFIPDESTSPNLWPEYFGHDYNGNEDVGYKVAICIRDIALYGMLAIISTIMLILDMYGVNIPKIPIWIYLVLILPMVLDGTFQVFAENFLRDSIPLEYINSISKRIVTGALFGSGMAIVLFRPILDSVE